MNTVAKAVNEEITRISSREVAKMMEVSRHSDMLEKIEKIDEVLYNGNFRSTDYWVESSYIASNGKTNKEYLVSKKGCEMLAHKSSGDKGILFTVKYMERFEEMERQLSEQQFKLPQNYKEALQQLIEQEEEKEKLQLENKQKEEVIKAQAPKVLFADAVSASHNTVLVGELAKILKQNGIDTGQKRMFAWLRDNGFLIKRQGTEYNMPTQKAMEMGLFEIKEGTRVHSDGHVSITKTTKVTGKGQIYFINKLKPATQLVLAEA